MKITKKMLEDNYNDVVNDDRYGYAMKRVCSVFKEYPLNTEDNIITIKIALLDLTHSTNLSKNFSNIELKDIVSKIKSTEINFDKRVENGDPSLVSELSKWSKEEKGVNLFSFFSKYCLYHNYGAYDNDDYVIYDSVLKENIRKYNSATPYKINKLRENFDYEEYKKIINDIIEENKLEKVDKVRRKIDLLIWYPNRKKSQ
jgi:hypothetical protein